MEYNWIYSKSLTENFKTLYGDLINKVYVDTDVYFNIEDEQIEKELAQESVVSEDKYKFFIAFDNVIHIKLIFHTGQEMIIKSSEEVNFTRLKQ